MDDENFGYILLGVVVITLFSFLSFYTYNDRLEVEAGMKAGYIQKIEQSKKVWVKP